MCWIGTDGDEVCILLEFLDFASVLQFCQLSLEVEIDCVVYEARRLWFVDEGVL